MTIKLTKTDMARVIIQALFSLEKYPAADDPRVTALARHKKESLESNYKLAHKVLTKEAPYKIGG